MSKNRRPEKGRASVVYEGVCEFFFVFSKIAV